MEACISPPGPSPRTIYSYSELNRFILRIRVIYGALCIVIHLETCNGDISFIILSTIVIISLLDYQNPINV